MENRIAVRYFPEKKGEKSKSLKRITRIVWVVLLVNACLLMLSVWPMIQKLFVKKDVAEKTISMPVSKQPIAAETFEYNHVPFLYSGHSYPNDSIERFVDRGYHYAKLIYQLDPELEAHYKVETVLHKVETGETLFAIAQQYNVSVSSLRASNDIVGDKIKDGMILRIQKSLLPLGYYGIDVSSWQNSIDWKKVHSDTVPTALKFFIIKATQGKNIVDFYFKHNWENAKAKNTIVGAYHFFSSTDDPILQANNFINNVELKKGDFLPILDLEYDCANCGSLGVSATQYIKNVSIYVQMIEKHYHVKPILYTYQSFYEVFLKNSFSNYPYWIADYSDRTPQGMSIYGNATSSLPFIPMWQFSSSEKINGVAGNVDISYLPINFIDSLVYR